MRSPLDLGFYPDQVELGSGLGRQRVYWTCTSFALLLAGIFSRQCIKLPPPPPLEFSLNNFRTSVFAASFLVAFALIGPFLRWFNRRKRKPSWEHIFWAFTFGFFLDLSTAAIARLMPWAR